MAKKTLDLPRWCAERKTIKRIREAMCPLALEATNGTATKAPASAGQPHVPSPERQPHALRSILDLSLAHTNAGLGFHSQSTDNATFVDELISVASYYPPGLGPQCSLPIDGCLDDSRASRQTDLGVLAQSRENVIHIRGWFRTASMATSYFTASHRTTACMCPRMTLLRGPITLWFSMSVQRTMPC